MQYKNLLIITNAYPHTKDFISSIFVKNQVDCLAKNFEKVYVIALTPYVPKFFNYLPIHPRWKRYSFAENYNYENIEVFFVKYFSLPFEFFRKRKWKVLKKVEKLIEKKRIKFDLIHGHFSSPSGIVSSKLKEKCKVPFVLTVHEDREWLFKEIKSKEKELFSAWKNADKIIRVNKIDLKELEKIGIEKEKLICIPNGFSSYFKISENARENLSLPNDKKILLNIGQLEEYKGQEYLIKAVKNLPEDIFCYIIGEGKLKNKLQNLINELNLQKKVFLIGGNKSREEIVLWLNACDVFILPSISESFGVVQIEAMACGKPVVATFNGGSEDIIINEKLGFLVKQKNSNELSNTILKALNNKWDKNYILNYARQFTWNNISQKILNVYIEISAKYQSFSN